MKLMKVIDYLMFGISATLIVCGMLVLSWHAVMPESLRWLDYSQMLAVMAFLLGVIVMFVADLYNPFNGSNG